MRSGDIIDGRFQIERRAGHGGMGEVYRAHDRQTGEMVAIKMLLPERTLEVARFEREARLLAGLQHPGIVRYVAHGVVPSRALDPLNEAAPPYPPEDAAPYLAMEWLEGCDLLSFLVRRAVAANESPSPRPLTVAESVTIASRVADALAYAHEKGVVHRDLKPTNIFLVDSDPAKIKLLDFGIAWFDEGKRITEVHEFLGTPAYMAPEQARSDQQVDARADVFSLGCVLFECLAGRPAFSGERLMAILAKILIQDPPRLRELRLDVPADLEALVVKMLAKEPDERPADGAAVVQALGAITSSIASVGVVHRTVVTSRSSLTRSERRALSVVLIGPARRGEGMLDLPKPEADAADEMLRAQASRCAGRLEHLADRSAVVTFSGVLASDQAAQAGRCALSLRSLAGRRPIALATGSGELSSGMPLGDAIDRAVRMLSGISGLRAEMPDDVSAPIAIDEVTAALLDARFEVRETEGGLSLIGELELAEGARLLVGKPTPCVGRDRDIRGLENIFTECVEDSVAQAVLMTAPAGAGKSRVAYEFMRRVSSARPDVAIWIGRGDSLQAGSAFGLLGQAVRGACGIRVGESIDVRRDKLQRRVGASVPLADQARVAEFLGELCGVHFEERDGSQLQAAHKDPQVMSDQMRAAWEEFLRAECSKRPVLIVLEDMHWGDLPTARFIDGALRRLSSRPLMVLALARPEVDDLFPKLWSERGMQEIRLKGLAAKACERLVKLVLGDKADAKIVDRLVALADGNAFYLEELIRAAHEQRAGELPETVVAMVQSRLMALEEPLRRALRAASVFGEVLWPGGVVALLGGALTEPAVRGQIQDLVERELIVRRTDTRFPGEDELIFRHALLREGAYAMLTEEDRVLGHRLAGEWLEQRGESDPMVLAEHFERGKDAVRAGGYYARAAELANQGGDTTSAALRAQRGLACSLSEEQRIALLGLICETYVWHPELAEVSAPYVEEVMRLAAPGSVAWARAALTRLMAALQRGRIGEFMDTVRAVMAADPLPDSVSYLVWALSSGVFYLDRQGQIDDAEQVLARADEIVQSFGDRDPNALGWLHSLRSIRDAYAREDPAEGLARGRACEACFQAIGKRRGIAVAQIYTGMNLWFLGAFEEAERTLRGIDVEDRELGELSSGRPFCLALVLADRGELVEARSVATRLVDAVYAQKRFVDEGLGRWALAEVLRRSGELDAAEREARAALELLSILPLDHIAASSTLAWILFAQGRLKEALSVAEGAMAKYSSTRACGWFRGQSLRVVLAECYYALGDIDAAKRAIGAACERLMMNVSRIDDPDYRRSFLERVPENARTLLLARQWLGVPGEPRY